MAVLLSCVNLKVFHRQIWGEKGADYTLPQFSEIWRGLQQKILSFTLQCVYHLILSFLFTDIFLNIFKCDGVLKSNCKYFNVHLHQIILISGHSHFVFLQKLRMKFRMYINFRTLQTVARSWRELKMFVFWEHWFGIASIMAWRLVRVLQVFKGNHRKFSVIGSQDKSDKNEVCICFEL